MTRASRTAARLSAIWLALMALGLCQLVAAQLSPGPLSRPHEQLEGSAHCLECHGPSKGVDPDKCLSCHELLAARVRMAAGLHSRSEYADCKTCHIDHHGLDFELVWWGEEGIETFDHRVTGHPLEGAHRPLDCRRCHRGDLVAAPGKLTRRGKDLDRTFLGLEADCLACHEDEHRGQLAGQSCESCHDQQVWKPAGGFDHQQARYTLTGRHRNVACEACHELRLDDTAASAKTFLRLTGLPFASCENCHQDPHRGRFGRDCESCHTTAGWLLLDDEAFDHDLTDYPLTGLHLQVSCEDCHHLGEPRGGRPFERCTDCHDDAHLGQLAGRPDRGACESCHDVDGFEPARFGVDDHQSVFALEGGHLAVACNACHRPTAPDELVRLGVARPVGTVPGSLTPQLRYASTRCVSCHADPHDGVNAGQDGPGGCAACHTVDAWLQVDFDHAQTDFELVAPHAPLGCRECHSGAGTEAEESLTFSGLGTDCVACHVDPHAGQFVEAAGGVRCERCHAGELWKPAVEFDHDRDSTFRLEGAHRNVTCDGCHPSEEAAEETFVRFRPLPRQCSDCHGAAERRES